MPSILFLSDYVIYLFYRFSKYSFLVEFTLFYWKGLGFVLSPSFFFFSDFRGICSLMGPISIVYLFALGLLSDLPSLRCDTFG